MANDDHLRVSHRETTELRYRSLLENDRVQHFLRRHGLTSHGDTPLRKEEVERRLRHIDERHSFDLMAQSVVEKALGIDRPSAKPGKSQTEQNSENDPYVTIYDNSCGITMLYKGSRPADPKAKGRGDEVLIVQSHTPTPLATVFKGFLYAQDQFTFKSRRLIDGPFSIAIYINGIIDSHLSTCCEYGLLTQCHFQLRKSVCQLVSISGGVRCDTCQYNALIKPSLSDDEETRSNSTFSEVPPESVSSSSRQSPQSESTVSIKSLKKDSTEVPEPVPEKPIKSPLVSPVNGKAAPEQSSALPAEQDLAKQKNDVSGPSNQTDEMQTIGASIVGKNDDKNNQPDPDIVKVNDSEKQNKAEPGKTKISNEGPTGAEISPEAKLEMEHLLDRYFDLFLPQASSSSPSTHAVSYTTMAPTSHTSGAVAQLAKSTLPVTDREMKFHVPASSSPPATIEKKSVETFELIWLDVTVNKNKDALASEQELRAIVNSLRTYSSINEAIAFIRTVPEKQVYLVMSGTLGQDFLKRDEVNDLPQIDSIYIFCNKESDHVDLKQKSYKVRDVFTNVKKLCERLKKDVDQSSKNLVPISGTSDTKESDGSQQKEKRVKFLCSQLHRDLLLSMEYPDDARNELIAFCSEEYKGNTTELQNIEDLKTYHAGKAIWWYTRETFLYKMLNEALYQRDVNRLHKLHFFIKDLHVQLEQLHSYYKPSMKSRSLPVYRGLTMPMDVFDTEIRRQKGNLIAFDTFLSTSLDVDTAKSFANKKKNPTDESILLHIEIDADNIGRPFADISRISAIPKEGEIFFSMGTVFRVVDVAEEKTSENHWIVHLISANDDDELLKKEGRKTQAMLLNFFKDVYKAQQERDDHRQIAATCVNMGSMYFKDGQHQNSLDLYKKALDRLSKLPSPDQRTMATYQSNIARVYVALKKPDEALVLYQQALKTRADLCQQNDPLRINTLHTIGNIYMEEKKYQEALTFYMQALELEKSISEPDPIDLLSMAASCTFMANALHEQDQCKKALEHFSKALVYQLKHLPATHPALAFLHNNIGAMYYRLKKYKEALVHHKLCLEIEENSLPPEHSTFIDSYRSMAETYEKLGKRDEAVDFGQKLVAQCRRFEDQSPQQLEEAEKLLDRLKRDQDIFK